MTRLPFLALAILLASPWALAQEVPDPSALRVDAATSHGGALFNPLAESFSPSRHAQGQLSVARTGKAYLGHQVVQANTDLAQARTMSLYLEPDPIRVVARPETEQAVELVIGRTHADAPSPEGYSWGGDIWTRAGQRAGEAILFVSAAGDLSGTIYIKNETFELVPLGDGATAIIDIDEARLPAGEEIGSRVTTRRDLPRDVQNREPDAEEPLHSDAERGGNPPVTHRLLVVYTDRIQTLLNQSGININTRVAQEVANTNYAYNLSQVDEVDLVLAGVRRVSSFDEVQGTPTQNTGRVELDRIAANAEIAALRTQYQADLVMVVGSSTAYSFAGIARLTLASQKGEYSILTWNALVSTDAQRYTFAHEVGHNQGAQHHRDDNNGVDTPPEFPYGHGWRFEDRDYFIFNIRDSYYATVMAYSPCIDGVSQCDVQDRSEAYSRILRFSNPYVQYDDQPTGQINTEHNSRVLANNAQRVASFYQNPLTASITTTNSSAPYAGDYSFRANTGGEETPVSYRWYRTQNPLNYGSSRSSSQFYTTYLGTGTWYLQLRVVGNGGTVRTVYRTVTVQSSGGGCFAARGPWCGDSNGGSTTDSKSGSPADPVAVADPSGESAPRSFTVRPNPSIGTSHVSVTSSDGETGSVKVYDLVGREVLSLHDGAFTPGTTTYRIETADLPPGVYVARLLSDTRSETTRFTVTR